MPSLRTIATAFILADATIAAPFPFAAPNAAPFAAPNAWWGHQAAHSRVHTGSRVHTRTGHHFPSGASVSNGVLHLTRTVTVPAAVAAPTNAVVTNPAVRPSPQPALPKSGSDSAAPAAPVAPVAPVASAAPVASVAPIASVAPAAPAAPALSGNNVAAPDSGAAGSVTEAMILVIAPNSKSCDGAPFADECATAAQAAVALNSAFAKYGITSPGAQAAVIAWESFETAQFKYKKSHFPAPGTPGKGTRCLMSPDFVKQYATEVYGADKVASAASPDAVLALANTDDATSFGAGAWYMNMKCPQIVSQFAGAPDATWTSFMTSCVNTVDTAERDAIWATAKQVLGA